MAVGGCRRDVDLLGVEMVTHWEPAPAIIGHDALLLYRRVVYRMGMPAATHDWTVAMLDALPDDGQRYEIIDGELFVTPAPGAPHQDVVGELYALLREYLKGTDVGKVVVSPSDVWRGERSRNRVQPDVFVLRRTDGIRPDYPYHLSNLLLAVEVLSPSNPLLDYHVKRDLYLREGVREYWVVDREARIVSRWSGRDEPGDVISLELRWKPNGMDTEFVLNLPQFFDEVNRPGI